MDFVVWQAVRPRRQASELQYSPRGQLEYLISRSPYTDLYTLLHEVLEAILSV